jgi:methionine-gamma-lyase
MYDFSANHGLTTLLTHYTELANPLHAHVAPIFQTSVFNFPDVATGAATFAGELPGYIYTRLNNPNLEQLARKLALLEGLDLLTARPDCSPDELVAGKVFASGMAAIVCAVLARVRAGDTILAQEAVYSNTFNWLNDLAPRLGLRVLFVKDTSPAGWEAALQAHPGVRLVYAETPVNPTMQIVDLAQLAEQVHRQAAWLLVDNTFATPYCQRPLSLGADIVVHSTTKYLCGHGTVIGGAALSRHVDFVHGDLMFTQKTLGATPSPFDSWLANLGLKTFELRMARHCANALAAARYLVAHPKVAQVYYPGLEDHPGHAVALRQMHAFGGMLSFELRGGLPAGERLMNRLKVISLAVSLGNVDSLIEHPASMTHACVPPEERLKVGITDGLVRFSVGIENSADLLSDLEQGLAGL